MTSDSDIVMLDSGPVIPVAELESTLGWTLKPQGLCRDDTCVIVPNREDVAVGDDGVDAIAVANLLDRPAVHDEASGLVAIGAPRELRRGALHDLRAPDFTLPDLDGTPHSLADHRSKKKLLVAFSSW